MMQSTTLIEEWQFMFLPVFLIVFWLLYVLRNLSSFRKEFQKMERRDRSSELGVLLLEDLKKKYIWRSIIALIVGILLYIAVYFILKQ
ncbi:hypothetical protein [Nonlabens xylanidelens]|uniref:hypothetical protein n=1 Tax=Nonlabens xylanidelens TaxID=191564 RepID=UPI000CEC3613|nr:hypothetical protein [Nonlabens xylanidelens]PQJ19807.1 hypothetical protein BST94_06070 [Nonlabens xylanidelens]